MAIQKLRTSPEAPDFDEAAGLTYEQAPDYDENSQGEFADDFTDPDYEETDQEYQPRKQK